MKNTLADSTPSANQNAANAWFLLGYIAWTRGDSPHVTAMLAKAHAARGKNWKPPGSVHEGDVKQRMFNEAGFLTVFEQEWTGGTDPKTAYARLAGYLRSLPR